MDKEAEEAMSAKNSSGYTTPHIFIKDKDGKVLRGFGYNEGHLSVLNSDEESPNDINSFGPAFLICTLVIVIFMIVKCILRARGLRLPTRCLQRIPTCKFKKGDPYDKCVICLEEYQQGETLRVLPCTHAYHAICVDPWLTQCRRVCPVCRRRVLTEEERPLLNTDDNNTQGETIEAQRENPFVRFMARLRRSRQPVVEQEAVPDIRVEGDPNGNGAQSEPLEHQDESSPLIASQSLIIQSERTRRPHRSWRFCWQRPAS